MTLKPEETGHSMCDLGWPPRPCSEFAAHVKLAVWGGGDGGGDGLGGGEGGGGEGTVRQLGPEKPSTQSQR